MKLKQFFSQDRAFEFAKSLAENGIVEGDIEISSYFDGFNQRVFRVSWYI